MTIVRMIEASGADYRRSEGYAYSCLTMRRVLSRIENNKPEAIKKLTEMVKDEPKNRQYVRCLPSTRRVVSVLLIYAVTGRKVNSSMLPADAGCIVDNVDTVASIYNGSMQVNSADPQDHYDYR